MFGSKFSEKQIEIITSSPSNLLLLEDYNAIIRLRKLVGPSNISLAKEIAPHSLNAIVGTDENIFYFSENEEDASKQVNFFYQVGEPNK